MSTGKLILHRKKNFNGMAVGIEIYLDEKLVEKMDSGQQKEFDLEPGTYKLKVQQNLKSGETDIVIEADRTTKYVFTPNPLSLITFLSPLIAFGLLFLFHLSLSYAAIILLPGAITSVYLLTSGRKKYFLFKPF